jgi:hypothetical protein
MHAGTPRMRDDHSSRTPIARRLQQPTRTARSGHRSRSPSRLRAKDGAPPLFGLAPGGVCRAAGVAAGAVRSYRTVSPLPRLTQRPRRFVLCGTVPRLAPAGCYPAPLVHGARTFLPGNLSVCAGAAVRPTDKRGMGRRALPVKGWRGSRCCALAPPWFGLDRDWRAGFAAWPVSTRRRRRRCAPGGNGAGTP